MAEKPAEELDLARMNLNWANLKLWFIQHRRYVASALILTMLFWAGIEYIYHPSTPLPAPSDSRLAWGNADSSFQVVQQGATLTLTRFRGGAQVYLLLFIFYLCCYAALEILALVIGRDGKPPHHRRVIAKRKNWAGLGLSIAMSLLVLVFVVSFGLGVFYPLFQTVTEPEVITVSPTQDLISWNGTPLLNISQVQYFYGKRHGYRIRHNEWGAHLLDGQDFTLNDDPALSSDVYDMDWRPSLVVFLNKYLDKTPPHQPTR